MNVRATVSAPVFDADSPERIRASDPLYWEFREFLDDEAALLDEQRLYKWYELLADDLHYWMPVRIAVHRAGGDGFAARMGFFDDTKKALAIRIERIMNTTTAWTEDPPTRTGRFVSNVRVFRTKVADEFVVESNLLVTRSRADLGDVKLLSAKRQDVLRRSAGAIKIARRTILLHHSTIDMQNFAIFF